MNYKQHLIADYLIKTLLNELSPKQQKTLIKLIDLLNK